MELKALLTRLFFSRVDADRFHMNAIRSKVRVCKMVLVLLCMLAPGMNAQNTGVSNNWLMGYGSYLGSPFGHTNMDFLFGFPVITYDSLEMDINRTSANISDAWGNLLFYTNGYYIADASHDTMLNGNDISPSGFQSISPYGLTVPQACLILPRPDSSGQYYLFHNTVDNAPYHNVSHYLYVSLIDMSLNGGLGAVVVKNDIILQDTLNPGKITACKHANGRDWWVICQQVNSNTYYKFLVTPAGISGPFVQSIGSPRNWSAGMAGFSPDGSKYAYFYATHISSGGLDIFDFDRCTGMLSNDIHITVPQSSGFGGGLAFSGNSRYLYISNIEMIFQYDMASSNIPASWQTVAVWDGFYSPVAPFGTYFDITQLAPDGKIYISTGNGTFHMHVINNPNAGGSACDVTQHSIQFPTYYCNGIPNHPNYFLGCDTTGGCPCLVTGLDDVASLSLSRIKAFPNPATDFVTIQFDAQDHSGLLEITDMLGKQILQEQVAPWSQLKGLDVSGLTSGIYLCSIQWNSGSSVVKIIKE